MLSSSIMLITNQLNRVLHDQWKSDKVKVSNMEGHTYESKYFDLLIEEMISPNNH